MRVRKIMGQLTKILGLCLLFVQQFDKAQGEIRCPPPFRPRGNECFFIHDDVSEALDWDESRQRCLGMGGDLAQPRDMVDFVKYINEEFPNIMVSWKSGVWLGATDREVERQWKWLSGEAVSSALWKIGEDLNPNTEPSGDGDCMNLFYIHGYFVNDASCTFRSHFACEIVPCVSPFVMVNGQCLMFISDYATWDISRSKCKSWPNTDIAVLNNVKEVAKYMRANSILNKWVHVGATNRNDRTKHTWINGTDVTPRKGDWHAGHEPGLDDDNQCVHIHPSLEGGCLADNSCNQRYASICERK